MNDEKKSLFRKASVDRLSSPEQLNDYLHVTTPAVWAVLAATIALLAGIFLWSCFAVIESYAPGSASVDDGVMTLTFSDPAVAENVETGMTVSIGDTKVQITSVGQDADGRKIATAAVNMPDGVYEAKVGYRQTQMIRMLFN
ncbi:MAG: hypothetical protein K6B72_05285 [Lachnospiraceae bacterium]|nr:hypothetical protein [Lachnospiraceae bacterium]